MKLPVVLLAIVLALVARGTFAAELVDVEIQSSADNSRQPARWFAPEKSKTTAVPLLVVLHTWSDDYRQTAYTKDALPECVKRDWALIHPNFRGPNKGPQAGGSRAAIADVLDAVTFAQRQAKIDDRRIYLVGTSGGGHMALVMAAHSPNVWAGVSSWVPVVDLAAWHAHSKQAGTKYWRDIEAVCGGPPGVSNEVDAEYRARSPIYHLAAAKGLPIDLNVGIHDGHTGSIPITHSLSAYNVLADANARPKFKVDQQSMAFMLQSRTVPPKLAYREPAEARRQPILLRRAGGPARLTVFDGGHEGDMLTAISWLAQQQRAEPAAR